MVHHFISKLKSTCNWGGSIAKWLYIVCLLSRMPGFKSGRFHNTGVTPKTSGSQGTIQISDQTTIQGSTDFQKVFSKNLMRSLLCFSFSFSFITILWGWLVGVGWGGMGWDGMEWCWLLRDSLKGKQIQGAFQGCEEEVLTCRGTPTCFYLNERQKVKDVLMSHESYNKHIFSQIVL